MSDDRLFNIREESKEFDTGFKKRSETIILHDILQYEFSLFLYCKGHYIKELDSYCGRYFFSGYQFALEGAAGWAEHLGLNADSECEVTIEIKTMRTTKQAVGLRKRYDFEGGGHEPYEYKYESVWGYGTEEIATDTVWSSRDLESTKLEKTPVWIVWNTAAKEGLLFIREDDAHDALYNEGVYPTISESFREAYPDNNKIIETSLSFKGGDNV